MPTKKATLCVTGLTKRAPVQEVKIDSKMHVRMRDFKRAGPDYHNAVGLLEKHFPRVQLVEVKVMSPTMDRKDDFVCCFRHGSVAHDVIVPRSCLLVQGVAPAVPHVVYPVGYSQAVGLRTQAGA